MMRYFGYIFAGLQSLHILKVIAITALAVCRMLVRLLVAKFSSIDVGNLLTLIHQLDYLQLLLLIC